MPPDVRIENLADHLAHAHELAALHDAEWSALEPEQTVAIRERDFRTLGRDALPMGLVALDGPRLVGSVLLLHEDLEIRPALTPWLAGVFVKPDYRRRGVASRLVQAAIDVATRQGSSELYLYTPHNESLYARLGFRRVERCLFRGTEITIMRRVA